MMESEAMETLFCGAAVGIAVLTTGAGVITGFAVDLAAFVETGAAEGLPVLAKAGAKVDLMAFVETGVAAVWLFCVEAGCAFTFAEGDVNGFVSGTAVDFFVDLLLDLTEESAEAKSSVSDVTSAVLSVVLSEETGGAVDKASVISIAEALVSLLVFFCDLSEITEFCLWGIEVPLNIETKRHMARHNTTAEQIISFFRINYPPSKLFTLS